MKNNRPTGKSGSGRVLLWILLVLALCIIIFLVVLYPAVMVGAPDEASIKIPAGATSENVRDSLEKHLGKDYSSKVMTLVNLRNTDFSKRHGAYTISKGMNALEAMRKLTSGGQTPVRVTINGFRNFPLLLEKISDKMEFPVDSLQSLVSDSVFMSQYGLNPDNAMALFLDDTYEFYWNTSARDVLKKIGDHYLYVWNPTRTMQAAEAGLTPADVTIIASITDEETNRQEEKGAIGQLYINRLHGKMKLQADPTVRFAIGDFTIKRITKKDLFYPSPFNTYLHPGLPPGPIRTTSEETIRTILESPTHNYLYMCAKEDFSGYHNFANTYEEHLKNAMHYQNALDRKGITR